MSASSSTQSSPNVEGAKQDAMGTQDASDGGPTTETLIEVLDLTTSLDASTITKAVIQSLIARQDSRITFSKKVIKGRTSSPVWNDFEIIFLEKVDTHFVRCPKCASILSFKLDQGTTTLIRHLKLCRDAQKPDHVTQTKKEPQSAQLRLQPSASSFFTKAVPSVELKKLNDNVVIGLAKDLRPLSSVERKGFQHICQSMVDFGARFGNQNVLQFLNHRTTLKNENLFRISSNIQNDVKQKLCGAPQHPYLAFTTDMWTEIHNNRTYLSLHSHFIDGEWNLCTVLLGVEEFELDKKTTTNVREQCKNILSKYYNEEEVSNIFASAHAVTDGGSNIVHVFDKRLDCQAHRLNLVLKWMLHESAIDPLKAVEMESKGKPYTEKQLFKLSTVCKKFKGALNGLKNLVSYFKRSSLNSSLSFRLKQDVPTRWNSEFIMLQSYEKTKDEVKALLLQNNQLHRLVDINDEAVQELCGFLLPFYDWSNIFSKEKTPTIQEVSLGWYKLWLHSVASEDDAEDLKNLKSQTRRCLTEYKCSDVMYDVAAFLHPRRKKLKFLEQDRKEYAYEAVRNLMVAEYDKMSSIEKGRIGCSHPPEPKKVRREEFEDSSDDEMNLSPKSSKDKAELEFDTYLRTPSKGTFDEDESLLTFWRGAPQFPALRAIAQRILAIPASEATDERVFSSTGQTVTPRRTCLNGSTLSQLTFIHKNVLL